MIRSRESELDSIKQIDFFYFNVYTKFIKGEANELYL